jgi:pilus assembly protein CpaB
MRPKSLALLLLALGCGLVASIGITRVMSRGNEGGEVAVQGKGILVAATDVGMGDLLTPEMVKAEEWPKDKTPPGAITLVKEIEGRRARSRLYVGEPILENRLFPKGMSAQGVSAMISKGFRIVPIKVDAVSGGSSLILPGDRVDVMAHFVHDQARGIKETITRTILQDVRVFAVNDVVNLDKEGSNKSINAKTISLLVTPKQASILLLATQMGVVNLVMRSPEGEEKTENVEARPSELFGDTAKAPKEEPEPPPVKPVPPPVVTPVIVEKPKVASKPTWTIRVLKQDGVEEVKFERESTAEAGAAAWKLLTSGGNTPDVPPIKAPDVTPIKPDATPIKPDVTPTAKTPSDAPSDAPAPQPGDESGPVITAPDKKMPDVKDVTIKKKE